MFGCLRIKVKISEHVSSCSAYDSRLCSSFFTSRLRLDVFPPAQPREKPPSPGWRCGALRNGWRANIRLTWRWMCFFWWMFFCGSAHFYLFVTKLFNLFAFLQLLGSWGRSNLFYQRGLNKWAVVKLVKLVCRLLAAIRDLLFSLRS